MSLSAKEKEAALSAKYFGVGWEAYTVALQTEKEDILKRAKR